MEGPLLVRLGALAMLFLSSIFLWQGGDTASPYLSVTFLDVGQGDSILIETPDGVVALIDGGADQMVLRELARELPWRERTIDLMIGTHPDKDHIGGLVDVLDRYQVTKILTTENRGETMTAGAYQDALVDEVSELVYARAGQVYALGASTTLTILSPARDPSLLESNTASIVAKLTYGDIDFMLTGDAPESIEDSLVVTYGDALVSEVLKLGHHGSRTSTGELFLATVRPTYAVVSAGLDNSYGHPHEEVITRVEETGATVLGTATEGAITFFTDGTKVWQK